ncbi:hypothetical protein [Thioclava sp. SK-1]|uniref:hypothetical protein n=1 Tax=Thioclava sp. SK-1 TaxID=1889770 RepID=UPI00114CA183|nr:hypothetical protein [Thioclava sp. SK-1]
MTHNGKNRVNAFFDAPIKNNAAGERHRLISSTACFAICNAFSGYINVNFPNRNLGRINGWQVSRAMPWFFLREIGSHAKV